MMIKKIKEIFKQRKKGFTLVELLAVLVVLAVIMAITIPTVLGSMSKSKEKAFEVAGSTIKKYLESNYKTCKLNKYSSVEYDGALFKNGTCELRDEIKSGDDPILIINAGYSTDDIEKVIIKGKDGDYKIEVKPNKNGQFDGSNSLVIGEINEPNAPDLSNDLVPIKYNGTNWVITTADDPDWYDYDAQKWANAASLVSTVLREPNTVLRVPDGTSTESDILAMFVWIPRFSYTIGCHEKDKCYGYRLNDGTDPDSLSSELPGAIDIKFISTQKEDSLDLVNDFPTYEYTSNSDRTPTNWYTHPAFNFGGKKLSGIWVGKFETSVNPNSDCYANILDRTKNIKANCLYDYKNSNQIEEVTPRVLPNVVSLTTQNIYNQYMTAKKFADNSIYGLNKEKVDSHMMKNSEWGAVAYLSQSIYGKYGNSKYSRENKEIYHNNSFAIYTGRSSGSPIGLKDYQSTYKYDDTPTAGGEKIPNSGTGASTTGNIYGIYDMNGGSKEYVMGNYNKVSASSEFEQTFFTTEQNSKYYNNFTRVDISKESVGNALYEVAGWYLDKSYIDIENYWLARGYAFNSSDENSREPGIFSFNWFGGGAVQSYSFRTVLVNK